uniref:Prolyl 4-hydroxylase alpha subunit Fe(2+) 2OG dioxygenase domain-containing protein n=1 Tax=Chromera velia CCMP2878 TaxID=1169474 RepID=A0A0G4GEC0_9ALVE|eukprot:Cvel_21415.t1-p1 / transcript=Cvel_21415.t1 / gene=Cvel_21415 / organism=Chromera_velia_CCMP2878 / gene_product=hypothetical protein / transcript_product=hypothetical protein / location=Cvel_scaffold2006:27693-28382(-) / protein_length=230 / sequence_SO=supercontig / SO=protein_coding / is_pseudo=false
MNFPGNETILQEIREELIRLSKRDPDATRRGIHAGSWRSSYELEKQSGHSCVQAAIDIAEHRARVLGKESWYVTKMWAKIDYAGTNGQIHNHGGDVAGIWYIDAGDSNLDDGALLFYPDANLKNPKKTGEVLLVPKTDLMVFWHAPMMHKLPFYSSNRPRIALLFRIDDVQSPPTRDWKEWPGEPLTQEHVERQRAASVRPQTSLRQDGERPVKRQSIEWSGEAWTRQEL